MSKPAMTIYNRPPFRLWLAALLLLPATLSAATVSPALDSYGDSQLTGLGEILRHRVQLAPLNFWVTLIFLGALGHTFITHKFRQWSHAFEQRQPWLAHGLHLLGEVEIVFGVWCLPLVVLLLATAGWSETQEYLTQRVSYIEPLFVVVIMTIAATRPVLQLAERALATVASVGGGRPVAWWLAILTLAPALGSFITEPAAMTIAALLLAKQFYGRGPGNAFAHATLGLLFVNISVGGVLTHFAAPPVLMVARPWHWNTPFMLSHFGLAAMGGIVVANAVYWLAFRREFARLAAAPVPAAEAAAPVPCWLLALHIAFLVWSVENAHHALPLIAGFMVFLAVHFATRSYQAALQLRSPLLVGAFLAGLVIHGGLQQWWIAPVLGRLTETPLLLGAAALTAFNDNAAVTYLATLVPGLTAGMKTAVVAGAVAGGGLTVIANAPNPAGQAILSRFFPDGVSPIGLFLGALPATLILIASFLLLR